MSKIIPEIINGPRRLVLSETLIFVAKEPLTIRILGGHNIYKHGAATQL